MIGDPSRANEETFPVSPSRQAILRDFEKLIEERKLFGAARDPAIVDGSEFDSEVLKKKEREPGSSFGRSPPGRSS